MSTLIHDGKEYDFQAALESPPIGAIDELNKSLQVTPKTIRTFFSGLKGRAEAEGVTSEELLYTHDYIVNFAGLLFLAKRRAGEPFTIAEAQAISYQDVEIRSEATDTDDEVDADPKVPSVPDDDLAAALETQTL